MVHLFCDDLLTPVQDSVYLEHEHDEDTIPSSL